MSDSEFRMIADSNKTPGVVVEKDGVHFGFYAETKEQPVLLLYNKGTQEIAARLPFPDPGIAGNFYTMKIKMQPSRYEYNFCVGDEVYTDPYAKLVTGREKFGQIPDDTPHGVRGAFPTKVYDWGDDCLPQIPYHEAVMYHLHVRGFTMQKNSGVRKKGTFSGLREKIPYLKQLGINQVKLMPVYEFAEMEPKIPRNKMPVSSQAKIPAQVAQAMATVDQYRMNFWGYGNAFYQAPKKSYAATAYPDVEFKDMVKAFHANDMEVLLEFSFPDEVDFSRIEQCLTYWAMEYHIDGFAIMVRDSVVAELARLPLLAARKLICTWYPDAVKSYRDGTGDKGLAESNDGFMNDCRRMLRGEEYFLRAFSFRLRNNPGNCAQINYMTNHDGFTLMDMVSYDRKYNMDNGEYNHDGTDYNYSWNCGEEGPSRKKEIRTLRMRLRKNAYIMMLFSQGTPMLLAGDEFGNSQNGNNNPYCHDSELTWLNWSAVRSNKELSDFVKSAIDYRKSHKVLHQAKELQCMDYHSSGYPDLSFHGERAWFADFDQMNRGLGCMYSGSYAGEDDFLYIAYNFNWTQQEFALPQLPKNMDWYRAVDTSQKDSFISQNVQQAMEGSRSFCVPPRTIVVLEGRK